MLLPLALACKIEPLPESTLVLSEPVVCADPDLRESLGPMTEIALPVASGDPGAGVVIADFNDDGHPDLFLPDLQICALLRGDGAGGFDDHTADLPALSPCDTLGGSAADVDGDGDLDLLLARLDSDNVLLINDGGAFTDGTDAAGLSGRSRPSVGASWGDMDSDGDLDLFIANHSYNPLDPERDNNPDDDVPEEWGASNTLLENRDGVLVEVSDVLTDADRYGFTFAGIWQDLNADGLVDLYLLNDFGDDVFANRYLRTTCGSGVCRLSDVSEDSALDLAIDAMGVGIGDLNGDGQADLAVTDNYHLHLLLSEGQTWYDAAASMGLRPDPEAGQRNAWGGELVDLDSDGDLDFLATFGPTERAIVTGDYAEQPDGLWLQDGGKFIDRAGAWGFDHTDIGRGFAVADLNGDGYPDIAKTRYRGEGPARVLLSRCGSASWLKVRLSSTGENTAAVGAEVIVRADGVEQVRWIHAGSTSLASGGPPEALFGLGDATSIDELSVRWPGGGEAVFADVAVNRVANITRSAAAPDP